MAGSVTIINYNENAHAIVSAAGRISTTEGTANEIYEKSCQKDGEKNIALIGKILSSGHESVLEHISVNLSFDNVSVFTEQFMIEFRLASFTVKSRRYVDFGNCGYVMPHLSGYKGPDAERIRSCYQRHMEYLFEEYHALVCGGIPKEDARFVLPYSFRSNFYCTMNARELVKVMNEMVYGRGKDYPELVALGESLFSQCESRLPYLNIVRRQNRLADVIREHLQASASVKAGEQGAGREQWAAEEERAVEEWTAEKPGDPGKQVAAGEQQPECLVSLVLGTEFPEKLICKAAALHYGVAGWESVQVEDAGTQRAILAELLKGGRKRELEQVNFTILFHRISLAGVTHLVRHRMQSIVIPDYGKSCDFDRYVLPESIVKAGFEERYRRVFARSREVAGELKKYGLPLCDQVYLLLSGMTVSVLTTMNANELYTFLRLRTCNRAQWEIKACADELLRVLRKRHPVLFSLYGPSCYVFGSCPEGKMSCGLSEEVCRRYQV